MYFGDGAVNDLDDWSNFLEVPDFMASFNCSQVRRAPGTSSNIYHHCSGSDAASRQLHGVQL